MWKHIPELWESYAFEGGRDWKTLPGPGESLQTSALS
jgi:hypothetical protein